MTRDSVRNRSECTKEIASAIRRKKQIIPILLHQDAEMPFRLGDRQYIDFTGDIDASISTLCDHLLWLKSPDGRISVLQQRLSDAEYEESREDNSEKRTALSAEVDALNEQIGRLQREIEQGPQQDVEHDMAEKSATPLDIQQSSRQERPRSSEEGVVLRERSLESAPTRSDQAPQMHGPLPPYRRKWFVSAAVVLGLVAAAVILYALAGLEPSNELGTQDGKPVAHDSTSESGPEQDTIASVGQHDVVDSQVDSTPQDPALTWSLSRARTLDGHTECVDAVAVTPDGTTAISGSWDNTLKVWDVETGMEIRTLRGHAGDVGAVAVTPDGSMAISGATDNTLIVWDIRTGSEIRRLEGHTGWVSDIAVTPDGTTVVSASRDRTLRIWDIRSGKVIHTLEGHTDGVNAVAVTRNGSVAISGAGDRTLKVWRIETGMEIRTLRGHTDQIEAVVVTPDGSTAISGSWDETLMIWDIETGVNNGILRGHTDWVNDVAVTPDGQMVLSVSDDETFTIWDIRTGQVLFDVDFEQKMECCTVAPDGGTIVTGDKSGSLYILELSAVVHTSDAN
jgi:WD40 repeat protein